MGAVTAATAPENPATQVREAAPFSFSAQGSLLDAMREAYGGDLINLAAGVPSPAVLPDEHLHAAYERARQKDGNAVWAYHHPEGDPGLKDALAQLLRERGVAAARGEDLLTVTGCSQGLNLLVSILVQPGDVVACEVPTYYALLEMLSVAGAKLLPLPVDIEKGLDLGAVEEALEKWKPRVLFTCSTLANPTGATIPEANRPKLVDLCKRHGVQIIEDDIYTPLWSGTEKLPTPLRAFDEDGDTVHYVSSFSKSVSPGVRVGYSLAGPAIRGKMARLKCQRDMHSSVLGEAIVREFIVNGLLEPHLAQLREKFTKLGQMVREEVLAAFPEGTVISPARGNYMHWAVLPQRVDLHAVREACLKERITFSHGAIFHPRQPEVSAMRLNCAAATREELIFGLRRLGEILKAYL